MTRGAGKDEASQVAVARFMAWGWFSTGWLKLLRCVCQNRKIRGREREGGRQQVGSAV